MGSHFSSQDNSWSPETQGPSYCSPQKLLGLGSVCVHMANGWRTKSYRSSGHRAGSGTLASPTSEHGSLGSGVSCVPQRKRLQA